MKPLILFSLLTATTLAATAQMDTPPNGGNIKATVSEEVGITAITINYSRPGVKGREGKIWGTVVPYGFNAPNFIGQKPGSPWRAGANEATTISFEHDVKVEGNDLKAGTYALFMAMEPDSSLLIFSQQKEAWGSFFYRPEDDVLRVKVKATALDKPVERLKYEFIDHKEKSCTIAMQWERLSVPFRVDVDVDNIVLARVREQMISGKGFASGNLVHASWYFLQKNSNLEEVLGWAQRAVTGQPYGQTQFENYRTLATTYEKLSRPLQADSVMNIALSMANPNQYTSYGRSLLAQKRPDRALEVLLTAQVKFGDTYAVNNALSYAYSAKGDYAKALEHATRALNQAATPQAKTTVSVNIDKLKAGKDIN
jgi:hypothetical protein